MNGINQLMAKLADLVGKGADFVTSEMPEVAKEILAYATAECWLYVAIGAFLMLAGVVYLWLNKKQGWLKNMDDNPLPVFGVILAGIGVLASPIIIFTQLFDIMKIHLAPKIYLLEYLRAWIKGNM